ncbi:B3GALTL [Lepeophtheirus salmonis]|uniref:General transcription factor IIF subunit 1 n=1 Tax=Lepeophtheirus salmonis TaxID=72036 RepID=A0A7R8D6H2_LEPSM|nr:B3GALTL [Lepeophtheirus salmonis]CAF3045052.1 B3GALTL [Lepeophtheirus salmonis]
MAESYTKRQKLIGIIIGTVNFFSAICVSLQSPFYPDKAEEKGATSTSTQYGLVFGVFELTVFIVCPIIGKFLVKLGIHRCFVWGIAITGFCCIIFGILDFIQDPRLFVIAGIFIRIFEALGNSAFITASFSIIAQEFSSNVATMFSTIEMCFGFGLIVGPTIGAYLYEVGGFFTAIRGSRNHTFNLILDCSNFNASLSWDLYLIWGIPKDYTLIVVALGVHGVGLGCSLVSGFSDAHEEAIGNGFENNIHTYGLVSGIWASAFALGAFVGPTLGGGYENDLCRKRESEMRGLLFLLSILACGVSGDPAEELSRMVFVLMSQEHDGQLAVETEEALKDELAREGLDVAHGDGNILVTGREAPLHGAWTFFPLFPLLHEEFKGDYDWFIFLSEGSRLNASLLVPLLRPYSPDDPLFLGNALKDTEHSVIHHYDNPGLEYPAFGSGFALSFRLVLDLTNRITKHGLEMGKFPNTFSIDPLYELANVIHHSHLDSLDEDDPEGTPSAEGPLLIHSPLFCLRPSTNPCATYSIPSQICPLGNILDKTLFAVKTTESFHSTRLPIILDTWGKFYLILSILKMDTAKRHPLLLSILIPTRPMNGLSLRMTTQSLVLKKIGQILACYDSSKPISLGQRYGFRVTTGEYGYDYITGGGGMVFSRGATRKMFSNPEYCNCIKPDYPDDMHLGSCMSNIGSPVIHHPGFHQARPEDYDEKKKSSKMANNGASSGSMEEEVSEFIVRVPPRNSRKSHHVMKFNASLNIDFTKWAQGTVRMVRENNQKASKAAEAEMPKYGAGSEFGSEIKKLEGATEESEKGGVAENTTYYVFTHAQDGAFEAHPISDWYNFTPILTYKTLNSEEAEEKFAERGKILNHWALMVNKKIRSAQDEEEEMDDDGSKSVKRSGKKDNAFKISDMDDWVEEGDELETDSEDEKKEKE